MGGGGGSITDPRLETIESSLDGVDISGAIVGSNADVGNGWKHAASGDPMDAVEWVVVIESFLLFSRLRSGDLETAALGG